MAETQWGTTPERLKSKPLNPPNANGTVTIGKVTYSQLGAERFRARTRARQRARYVLRAMYPDEWAHLLATVPYGSEAKAVTALCHAHPDDFTSAKATAEANEPVLTSNPVPVEAVSAYLAGECSAMEIARRFGAGVRLLAQGRPDGAKDEHQRQRWALRIEQATIAAEVEAVRRLWAEGIRCGLCWGLLPPKRRTTCGNRCAKLWAATRYQLDEDQRQKMRTLMAQRLLVTGSGSQAWARNLLAGTVKSKGRWTIPGSAAQRAVAEVQRLRAENIATFGPPENPLPKSD